MQFLSFLASVGWIACLVFVLFSVACSLYIISEWVEEHPRFTRKTLQYTAWVVDGLHIFCLLDGLSIWRIIWSTAINHIYTLNLSTFPLVNMSNPVFLGSCGLAIANHFVWFYYFINSLQYPFGQVCAFMFFCVWMLPLGLFVSLTPLETSLPNSENEAAAGNNGGRKTRQNMFKTLFTKIYDPSSAERQDLHTE